MFKSLLDATTPEENPEKIKFALAWSNRGGATTSGTLHLPSDSTASVNHSPSSSALYRGECLETHNVDDIVEKLQHESNIYLQADYLNYLYNTQ